MVGPYLLAVLVGGIFALLFHPWYVRLQRRSLHSKFASLLVTLAIFVLLIGPVSLFATLAVRQGVAIGQALASSDNLSFQSLMNRIGHWRLMEVFFNDSRAFEKQIIALAKNLGKSGTSLVFELAADIPKILLQLALSGISCFFLLIDGRRFLNWLTDKVPLDSDVRVSLINSFKNTTVSVIWATFAAAAAQASVIFISFLLLRVPAAFLAAGSIFVLAWIPMIGSTPVWLIGAIYLYFHGTIGKCVAMIAFGVFTGVVDNFVRPLVLKGRGGMHPLISLIAIFGGIQMFGILGVFLGPILAAVMISLLQTWPSVAERFGLVSKEPAIPQHYKS